MGAGPERVSRHNVEVCALGRSLLLELMERLRIDSNVKANLGAGRRTAGVQRFRLVEQAIKVVGTDLVVVLHSYIMPLQRSRW